MSVREHDVGEFGTAYRIHPAAWHGVSVGTSGVSTDPSPLPLGDWLVLL